MSTLYDEAGEPLQVTIKHSADCPGKWLIHEDWLTNKKAMHYFVPCRGECYDMANGES